MKSAADLYAKVRSEYAALLTLQNEREVLKNEPVDAAVAAKADDKKDAKAADKKSDEADKAKKAKDKQDREAALDKQITQEQEGLEQLLGHYQMQKSLTLR